jgi:response regulator RpfG family c-di-GMP phosphodiesterase
MEAVSPAAREGVDRPPDVPTILVVDDEDTVRQLLVRWLAASGYAAASARGADEALARLETNPAAVVLCDIRMPGHNGLWLAGRIRERYPETAVIMSSGVQDLEAESESARYGVVDYLLKPFGRDRLRDAVSRAVDWHQSACDARRWRDTLHREMDVLKASLWDRVHAYRLTSDQELEAMLASVTAAIPELYTHSRRVATLALALARVIGAAQLDLTRLRRAALLHDLGKLAIPEAVIRKPAPLGPDEQELVRTVPFLTARLVEPIPFLAGVGPILRDIGERMDGGGYPRGVRAETVPLESRIIAVADAYDTMTHPRVYRDPIPRPEALLEVARCAGTQFDPVLASALDQATAETAHLD